MQHSQAKTVDTSLSDFARFMFAVFGAVSLFYGAIALALLGYIG